MEATLQSPLGQTILEPAVPPIQGMGPTVSPPLPLQSMRAPGPAAQPQPGGMPRRRRGLVISKGMIAMLIGLAFLMVVGSVGFLRTTNRAIAPAQSPYTHSGTLVLNDPLADNSKGYGWDEGTSINGKGVCQFTGGAYHVSAQEGRGASCFARNITLSDFTYEVQMTIVQGEEGGIVFRYRTNGEQMFFYLFTINSQGDYHLDSFNDIVSFTTMPGRSPAIKVGLNQSNLVAVVARGNTIEIYVNGQPVTGITDDTSSQGKIGVVVDGSANTPGEVVYSNARVWELP